MNRGTKRSVITNAVVTVERFHDMPQCVFGSRIAVDPPTDVVLPGRPDAGETVDVSIAYEVGPDQTTRIPFRLDLPEDVLESYVESGLGLYVLRVALEHDEGRRTESEPALVAVPETPEVSVLDDSGDADTKQAFGAKAVACIRRNRDRLRQMLSLKDVEKPKELSALAD